MRKGCDHKYQPRRWNQRYCQDPDCRRELRRWQAARRQAERRRDVRVKIQHAQAERERRQRARTAPKTVENRVVTLARGHAARGFFLLPYALGRAATKVPQTRPATPRASAAPRVARLFATSWIGSASGFLAALWMGARNGPSSTAPRAGADPSAIARRNHRATAGSATMTIPPNRTGRQLSRRAPRPI
jgi:hypothetical protein